MIKFQGAPVRGVPDGLAMVFQEYGRSLLPWKTVNGNIDLPLRYQKVDADERRRRIDDSLQAVGLSGFGERYPWQLSGGMQQRVAIARALAYQPKLLLMDEPFASVDAQTRADLEDLVAQVRDDFGITIVLVTHDIDESVYLSDRVIVLSKAPSTVQAQIDIGLSRPRDQIRTKAMPQFVEKRSIIAGLIRRPPNALLVRAFGGSVSAFESKFPIRPERLSRLPRKLPFGGDESEDWFESRLDGGGGNKAIACKRGSMPASRSGYTGRNLAGEFLATRSSIHG
jgi:NitT/TauT family transport system ATP-binding protein